MAISIKLTICRALSIGNNVMLALLLSISVLNKSYGDQIVETTNLSNSNCMESSNTLLAPPLCNIISNSVDGKRHFVPAVKDILLRKSFIKQRSGVFIKENVNFGDIRKELGFQRRDMEMVPCGSFSPEYTIDVDGGCVVIGFHNVDYDVDDKANEEKLNNNLVNVRVSIWNEMKPLSLTTNVVKSVETNEVR